MNIVIDGKRYHKVSEQGFIYAYNKGKNVLWIFKADYGMDKIIFSKSSELGDAIITHIKFFIEMKTKFNIQFNTNYFYFVQL